MLNGDGLLGGSLSQGQRLGEVGDAPRTSSFRARLEALLGGPSGALPRCRRGPDPGWCGGSLLQPYQQPEVSELITFTPPSPPTRCFTPPKKIFSRSSPSISLIHPSIFVHSPYLATFAVFSRTSDALTSHTQGLVLLSLMDTVHLVHPTLILRHCSLTSRGERKPRPQAATSCS